ncbi:hypothetical protein DDP43_08205 [Helicobacter pylori]|uniref:hypothetical protein n=1 Tax=Helicobacter pylori TaxID=210 RepID=UPI000EB05EDD|nr:hypothetical protein [Helicobacter pylori]RKV03565.1 hypothetical protein DDP43_08205 [Helicobacter pylori]
MFADKQTPTSEALASMDKSASQFESVGVSRSCFCVSKIKQDSANLVLKTKTPKYVARHARCFCLHVLNSMLFLHVLLACARVRDWGLE